MKSFDTVANCISRDKGEYHGRDENIATGR